MATNTHGKVESVQAPTDVATTPGAPSVVSWPVDANGTPVIPREGKSVPIDFLQYIDVIQAWIDREGLSIGAAARLLDTPPEELGKFVRTGRKGRPQQSGQELPEIPPIGRHITPEQRAGVLAWHRAYGNTITKSSDLLGRDFGTVRLWLKKAEEEEGGPAPVPSSPRAFYGREGARSASAIREELVNLDAEARQWKAERRTKLENELKEVLLADFLKG